MDEQNWTKLDEIQYLLERMLELAETSANPKCDDTRRHELQKGVDILRQLIDNAADQLN